jgi:D-glycero-D-manno-heptose 1,7-bisphosphate phosphatase
VRKNKIFFFDRDGVLIKNYGYLIDIQKIKWLKGAVKAIRFLNKKRIKVIVITNQSGVARGYFTISDLRKFHNNFLCMLNKRKAYVDKIYFCPFHKKAVILKYKKDSFDRKPNPGMILKALKNFKIKKEDCFMIGDNKSDYLASKNAGIRFEFKKNYSLNKQVQNIFNKFLNN